MTAVNRLMDFYNLDIYNISNRKDYYSFADYRRFVIGNVLDIVEKETGKNAMESPLDEIDSMLTNILKTSDILTRYKDDTTVLPIFGSSLFESLYDFETTTVCDINYNLYNLLTNTSLPKTFKISRFILPRVVLLFPVNNSLNFVTVVFTHTKLINDEGIGVCIIDLEQPLDFSTAGSRSFFVSYNETINSNEPYIKERLTFVYNFLLWQQSNIDKFADLNYITEPFIEKKGFGEKAKQTVYPREIGRLYNTKVINLAETTGTHASPRTHWRSGHWRKQPFGTKKEPQYRDLWIQPTLING